MHFSQLFRSANLLSFSLATSLSLIGCGTGDGGNESKTPINTSASEATSNTNTSPTPELIESQGQTTDKSQNEAPPNSFLKLEDKLFLATGRGGTIFTSTDSIDWTERNSVVNADLNDVSGGKAVFVAVGEEGTIVTSTNGVVWSKQTSNTDSNLNSIAWGNNHFVAIGAHGTIVISRDGINWTTPAHITDHYLNQVIWSGNQFVAVGRGDANGIILTSPDAVNWTVRRTGGHIGAYLNFNDIAWNGFQYVAIGSAGIKNCIGNCSYYVAYRSIDGITWTEIDFNETNQAFAALTNIEWDGSQYVAYGNWSVMSRSGNIVITSHDGLTWEETILTKQLPLNDISIHDGNWFSVDRNGNVYSSNNGASWKQEALLDAELTSMVINKPTSVVTINSAFMFSPIATYENNENLSFTIENKPEWAEFDTNTGALWGAPSLSDIDRTDNIVISVTDGINTVALDPITISVTQGPYSAPTISGNPESEIAHNSNYHFTPDATDGNNDILSFSITNKPSWAEFNKNTGTLSGTPAYEDVGLFTNIVISASDGIEIVPLKPFDISVTNSAPFINIGHWIAVAPSGVYTSQDASNWKQQYATDENIIFGNKPNIHHIATNGSTFVAIDTFEKVFISDDSYTWLEQNVGHSSDYLTDIVAGNNLFVAVGSNYSYNVEGDPGSGGTKSKAAFLSNDGVTWTAIDIDPAGLLSVVEWNGAQYVALGYDTTNTSGLIKAYTSQDAISWEAYDTGITGHINDIIWDGSQFIAVGNNIIISSTNGMDWANQQIPQNYALLDAISWNGTRYVSVGGATTTNIMGDKAYNATILTSEDGSSWEEISLPTEQVCYEQPVPPNSGLPIWSTCVTQTIPSTLGAITWNGSEFVAMGKEDMARSSDGINWTTIAGIDPIRINDLISTTSNEDSSTLYIAAGKPYTLTPYASDPEGDPLTYSIEGLPSWASFDQTTGMLTGTPSTNEIGKTDYVTIAVSDGYEPTSLRTLELIVKP